MNVGKFTSKDAKFHYCKMIILQSEMATSSTQKVNDIEISFDDLTSRQIKKQSEFDLNFSCNRFDIINNTLWCVQKNTSRVQIHSTDGAKQRTIDYGGMGKATAIVRFNNKALVSAFKGLFTISWEKRYAVTKVFAGQFDDVCSCRGHVVYALTRGTAAEVVTISYSDELNKFTKEKSYKLVNYNNNMFNTITATSSHVFVAQYDVNVIQQYTLDGQLIQTYNTYGSSGIRLIHPFLAGCDKFNSVLIAGNHNQRLDVLKADDGSFQTQSVEGIGRFPVCARIHDNKLYVVCWKASSPMQVFSIR